MRLREGYRASFPMDWDALAWQSEEALCRRYVAQHGLSPDYWFPEKDQELVERRGLYMCFRCPLRRECLDYAMAKPERAGTWGGMTAHQRGMFRKRFVAGQVTADELMDLSLASAQARGLVERAA